MEFTGERFLPWMTGQIAYEHLHRYAAIRALCKGKRVLDIASGEGFGTNSIAAVAASAVGIDVDEASVSHAARTYVRENLRYMTGHATAIPLEDNSVDLVVSFETLQHFADHDGFLREVKRVLVSDGSIVLSTPNRLVYTNHQAYSNPYHVNELDLDGFRDLTKRYFKHVRMFGQQIAAVSLLHPIDGDELAATIFTRSRVDFRSKMGSMKDPMYHVAICSDKKATVHLASVFVDPDDALLKEPLASPDKSTYQLYFEDLAVADGYCEMTVGTNTFEAIMKADRDAFVLIRDVNTGVEFWIDRNRIGRIVKIMNTVDSGSILS